MNIEVGCFGKQAHVSWAEANARLKYQRRRLKKFRRKSTHVEIYRCHVCRQWHIGSTFDFH